MRGWSADFTNDPDNDYALMIEILYNHEDVAVIRQGEQELELQWYANKDDLVVPLEWISSLILEAKERLTNTEIG